MRSRRGLEVLLLAALLSAVGFWLSNTTVDILFMFAGASAANTTSGPTAHMLPLTGTSENRTSTLMNSTEASESLRGLTEEATAIPSELPLDSEETSFTQILNETHNYPATTALYNFSTPNLDPVWTSEKPFTTQSTQSTTDVTTGLESVTATNVTTQHVNFSPSLPVTEKPSAITAAAMETDNSVCIRNASLTDAEVLAIAIGAVFLTIILSALLYQLVAFLSKKNASMGSSVFIIENELNKYDLEANGIQPETKL